MSSVLCLLLALLGFTELQEVPVQYVDENKDGIVFIDPAIAGTYEADRYDQIKEDVYLIQEQAYPGGIQDVFGAD